MTARGDSSKTRRDVIRVWCFQNLHLITSTLRSVPFAHSAIRASGMVTRQSYKSIPIAITWPSTHPCRPRPRLWRLLCEVSVCVLVRSRSLNINSAVVSADGLPLRRLSQPPNVSVKAAVEGYHIESKVKPRTSSPKWNEEFQLCVTHPYIAQRTKLKSMLRIAKLAKRPPYCR